MIKYLAKCSCTKGTANKYPNSPTAVGELHLKYKSRKPSINTGFFTPNGTKAVPLIYYMQNQYECTSFNYGLF